MYGYRWSDESTWGGDFPPTDGDTVYVPPGMVLIVDQTTSKLFLILVEGVIIFSDETPLTVQAETILVTYGRFQAGTEDNPFMNQLTFIMSGSYYDKQLPAFGNKVIGCYCCTFDMYGKVRNVTWTELSQTSSSGTTKVTLTTAVDWQVGEDIVVASSSFSH